jgi:hypothetical protein
MCKRELDEYFQLCKPDITIMQGEDLERRLELHARIVAAVGPQVEGMLWYQAKYGVRTVRK